MSELTKLRVIYTGQQLLKGNKPGDTFILESVALANAHDAASLDHAESIFAKVKVSNYLPLRVGLIYEINGALNETGLRAVRLTTNARKLIPEALDPKLNDAVMRWNIRDAGVKEELKAFAAEKKFLADAKAMSDIRYLRHIYQNTPHHLRRGFELGVMALIRAKS